LRTILVNLKPDKLRLYHISPDQLAKAIAASNAVTPSGNILLGDGSAQQCSSASFRVNWLRNADAPVPWPAGHVPSVPSIRLVFP